MKKTFLIPFLFLAGVFVSGAPVLAIDTTVASSINHNTAVVWSGVQLARQGIKFDVETNISEVSFWLYRSGTIPADEVFVDVHEGTPTGTIISTSDLGLNPTFLYPEGYYNAIRVAFPFTDLTLAAETWYYFIPDLQVTGGYIAAYSDETIGPVFIPPTGYEFENVCGSTSSICQNVFIGNNENITPLVIDAPAANATLVNYQFDVTGTCTFSDVNELHFDLVDADHNSIGQGSTVFLCNYDGTFLTNSFAANGTYEFRVQEFNRYTKEYIQEANNLNITIDDDNNPITPPPPPERLQCDTGDPISKGFCNVLVFLFQPNKEAFDGFAAIKEQMKNKPPFGYFTAAQVLLTTLQAGTAEVEFDLSSLNLVFNPIKAGIAALLWILFVLWIIKRFQNIAL